MCEKCYKGGFVAGMASYAWWKDGTEYVGTSSAQPLKQAIAKMEQNLYYSPDLEECVFARGVITKEVPANLKKGLDRYIEHGYQPGGFLMAVLTNNLIEAVARADYISIHYLANICAYVYNELPLNSWGDKATVKKWIEKKAKERR